MKEEPVWLLEETILAVHDAQIGEHGGPVGLRDRGLLESALARPRNLFAYQGASLFQLAAAYGAGIVRNHPFVDGNKRTAYVATRLFLLMNGFDMTAEARERVITFMRLAAGELDEPELARGLEANSAALP
ncbi:MAG: type II toxin-antitoxin system death-on-curing family toxin [Deltaproteobacteria bacterium]|nr:type II toxin-antitoxin system death-on-curing family toxin [Deltaproteobacteria bacterium]